MTVAPAPTVVVTVAAPLTVVVDVTEDVTVVVALPEDAADVDDEMLVVGVRDVLGLGAVLTCPVVVMAALSGAAENEATELKSPQPANAEVTMAKTTSEPNATLNLLKRIRPKC